MTADFAENDGVRIAYETFGDRRNGEPLLLMMGLTFQMIWWPDEFCAALVDQGFTVARFDNRDAGLSTHFTSPPTSIVRTLGGTRAPAVYTANDMVGDALAVLNALGWDSAHLMGESLGASLAALLALDHPGRVRSLTSCMGSPGGGLIDSLRYLNVRTVLQLARRRYPDTRDGGVQRMVDTYTTLAGRSHPLDHGWIRDTAERSWDRAHDPSSTQRQLAAIGTAGRFGRRLPSLDLPTLVLHGEDNPWLRVGAARRLARQVPGARLVTYPQMGHDFPPALWPEITGEVRRLAEAAAL